MEDSATRRHAVVVIGAGQTGLAAAYHLARRGFDFVVLEASERVGDVWRNRYDSLLLYSPAPGNALPGLRFPLPRNAFPTGRQMGDYLEAYAKHHRFPLQTGVRVRGLRARDGRDAAGFEIATSAGLLIADQVIVATGAFQRPRVPEFAGQLDPGIRQLHSADYRGPRQLAEGPVLVVGLSHSGADIAHEVALAGHPTILSGKAHGQLPFPIDSRRGRYVAWPMLRFLGSNLLNLSTPIGRRAARKVRRGGGLLLRIRRPELEAAGVDLRPERTVRVENGKPVLEDGSVLEVRNVVWCTGFSRDYRWIEPSVTGPDGWPRQHRGVVQDLPGLYILGIPFLYAFTSMLVTGADRDARYVVERAAALAGRRALEPQATAA
ncbi:MAG TPA: FAD-dependent oxidoreductase [Candidatus Limnocylindria bacterium]